jgi:hypothetical protein
MLSLCVEFWRRSPSLSIVKDASLSAAGRQKIDWVRSFMPALSAIEMRFAGEKPFAGLTVASRASGGKDGEPSAMS